MQDSHFFTVGGTVQAGGGRYLPRAVDDELLDLCMRREFAFVLTARQMGKSSLMVRTAQSLAEADIRSVIIDLSQIGVMVSADAWYLGLLSTIEEALDLDTDLFAWWEGHTEIGHAQRFTKFLQEVVLGEVEDPIVIFIDEIDTTLSLDFTDDFFAAIRYIYNARARIPAFERLSFVLIGVATPSDLISDPSRTPFNIGKRVDVDYFTLTEAMPLTDGFAWPADKSSEVLQWILSWTEGHPYLTQRVCQSVSDLSVDSISREGVDKVVHDAFLGERSDEDNNIRFVNDMMTLRAPQPLAVLETYRKVLRGRAVADDRQSSVITHLKLAGIVASKGGKLQLRNRVYGTIFNAAWISGHWPETWVERIPVAIKGLVAAMVLALLAMGWALNESSQRQDEGIKNAATLQLANDQLTAQFLVADSLKIESTVANAGLSVQIAVTESLRAEEAIINRRLVTAIDRADVQTLAANQANEDLQVQAYLSDSLRSRAEAGSDSLRLIAAELTVEAANERSRTVSLALATTAVRQIRLGDPVLGALLARQAFLRGDGVEDEFIEPVHDALVQSLNAISGSERVGGPAVLPSLGASARAIAYAPNGLEIASGLDNGRLAFSSATGLSTLEQRGRDARGLRAITWSTAGDYLITASDDGWVRRIDRAGDQPAHNLVQHAGGAWALAMDATGDRLATAGADGVLNIVEPSSGSLLASVSPMPGVRIRDIAFMPDGRNIVCAMENGTLWFGTPDKPESAVRWSSDEGRLLSVAVIPDGSIIASGGESGIVRLWTTPASQPSLIEELQATEGAINTLAFSADGRLLASGSADNGIAIWTLDRAESLPFIFREHSSWVMDVAFAPDDTHLASSAADGTVRVWTVDTTVLAQETCRVANGRDITEQEWQRYVGTDIPYGEYQSCSSQTDVNP